MSSAPVYSPGVMKYVEAAKKLLAERDEALARMKAMKFDTVAVHEALEQVRKRSGLDSSKDQLVLRKAGQHDDLGARARLADASRGLHTAFI